MKVTGFSFIRNALKYDYPIVEAITSILPICDDFVVAVGNSDDDTLGLIKNIAPDKIRILETIWDDSIREGGKTLALETNKAFHAIGSDSDWCFYIQGDEVVHEKYLDNIHKGMQQYKDNLHVDGLLLKYLHFYGSYDYVSMSPSWYSREIRVIRNDKKIYSYRDAQGFRKGDDEKLNVKAIDASMYHYGWVREPEAMQRKHEDFGKYWHSDDHLEKKIVKAEAFDYTGRKEALRLFKGTHPKIMEERIRTRNWHYDHDISHNNLTLKERLKMFAENRLGINTSYKNYKLV